MPSDNLNKITSRRSYNLTEIASLLGKDRKTYARWVKKGLKVIEEGASPILVKGSDLKDFIKNMREKRKIHLKEDEFLCMKCHKARKAKAGSESIVKTGKKIGKDDQEQLKKTGICEVCGTEINRYLKVCQ